MNFDTKSELLHFLNPTFAKPKNLIIRGLYKEAYGKYEGKFSEDDQQICITTDRYFEKYVLLTDDGVYEIWAGGIKKKDDLHIEDFQIVRAFESMNNLKVRSIQIVDERSLIVHFEEQQYFEVGLCPAFNAYNHPERYLKFVKYSSLK